MSINLYLITTGNMEYRYTSSGSDVSEGGNLWEALPLKRTDLSLDLKNTDMTLTMPDTVVPFTSWKHSPSALPIEVEVLDYPSMVTKFKGVVLSISFTATKGTCSIKVGNTNNIDSTSTPNRSFGYNCSFDLYGTECGLNIDDYKIQVAIQDCVITSTTITSDVFGNKPDWYYTSGYILLDSGEAHHILSHLGTTISVLGNIGDYSITGDINVVVGCNKTKETCLTKFGNISRFGGFPFIPTMNPATEGI